MTVDIERHSVLLHVETDDVLGIKEYAGSLDAYGAETLHFDVSDGLFYPKLDANWSFIRTIKRLCSTPVEVHLKSYHPFQNVEQALMSGVDRIAFHFEATEDLEETANMVKTAGGEVGLAFQVGSDLSMIRFCPKVFDYYLVEVDDTTVINTLIANIVHIDEYLHGLLEVNDINDVPRIVIDYHGRDIERVKPLSKVVDGIVFRTGSKPVL